MLKTATCLALAASCLLPIGAAAQDAEEWRLYDFSATKLIELDVKMTEDGATQTGSTRLEFQPAGGDQVKLTFSSSLGESSAQFTTTAAQDQIYNQAMMQMMMTPAAAPVVATLFAPFWAGFFVGRDMSIGAGWSFNDGSQSVEFKVESACANAGMDGKKVVWRENGEVRAQACINPQIPLPLALMLNTDDGKRFDINMKKYEAR